MNSQFDEFEEFMRGIDAETHARADALANDPNYRPPSADLLDDPDPFGMGWEWANPQQGEARTALSTPQPVSATPESPPVIPFTPRLERRSRFRWVGYGAGAAIAASLLIGLGILIASKLPRGGGTEVLVANASPVYGPGRGAERELRVEMRCDLAGFAAVLALAPTRWPEIFPGPGGEDIPITSGVPKEFGPLTPGTTRVLFVVTETPAAEPIRKALRGKTFTPDQVDELQAFLRSALEAKGYRRMGFGTATYEPPSKE
jgi:hypothetical protein